MAKSFGELMPGILARTAQMMRFQEMLNLIPEPGAVKTRILDLWAVGEITREEAELLISAYQVEAD